jgi:hypothetical protein
LARMVATIGRNIGRRNVMGLAVAQLCVTCPFSVMFRPSICRNFPQLRRKATQVESSRTGRFTSAIRAHPPALGLKRSSPSAPDPACPVEAWREGGSKKEPSPPPSPASIGALSRETPRGSLAWRARLCPTRSPRKS